MPPQTRRTAKAAPNKVGARPASSPPRASSDYAEMITGGMLTLAGMLAGVNRRSAARVVLVADQAGRNVAALAAHDKRVAKFLDRFTAPTVYGAAATPFVMLGIGLAADAGLLAGTPLEHMAPPMPDEVADEILAEVGIGSAGQAPDTTEEYLARMAAEREFAADAPPPPTPDSIPGQIDLITGPGFFDGYAPNTPESAAPPG